ncbi:hypothetical protein [Microbacterium sp. LWH13-1.2]|uniref:hypothetical protein n=1 Tax=Microbacterium sp. LWH13-1.2 TaxID=3135260 RepID=UPI00313A36B6
MTDKIFHCRATGLTLPAFSAAGDAAAGRVLSRGETFTVSPETYELTKDRLGSSFLDLTPQEQVQKWGSQRFGTGPAPEDMVIGEDDEYQVFKAAFAKLEYSRKISDPAARKLAVQKVWRDHGEVLRHLNEDYR